MRRISKLYLNYIFWRLFLFQNLNCQFHIIFGLVLSPYIFFICPILAGFWEWIWQNSGNLLEIVLLLFYDCVFTSAIERKNSKLLTLSLWLALQLCICSNVVMRFDKIWCLALMFLTSSTRAAHVVLYIL